MDANTVQEIANQLGIGVDQILQYLPAYASSKIAMNIMCIGIFLFLIMAAILLSVWLYKKYKNCEDFYDEDGWFIAFLVLLSITFVLSIVGFIAIGYSVENIVMWTNCPELWFLKSIIPG